LGTFVPWLLLAPDSFFSLGPGPHGPRLSRLGLRPSNKPDLTRPGQVGLARWLGASTTLDSRNRIAPIRRCLRHDGTIRPSRGCKRQPEPEIRVSARTVACRIWPSASQLDNLFLAKGAAPKSSFRKKLLRAPGTAIVQMVGVTIGEPREIGSTTCKYLGSAVIKKYDVIHFDELHTACKPR
jgi:hypothetical protein